MATHYLACDLGADSGRLMLGTLDHGKIEKRSLDKEKFRRRCIAAKMN